MMRTVVHGRIHRATVTAADLHHVGPPTVDADPLEAADLLPGQQVDVVDLTDGARLTTYPVEGERGAGEVRVDGAAAHPVHPGDVVFVDADAVVDVGSDARHVPDGFGPKSAGVR